jgi:steroid delta-isomerase-like uncharacterized protein
MAGTYSGLIRASKLDYLHAVLIVQVERAVDVPRDDIRKENAMATISEARQATRIKLVDEHVRVENTGDIEATLGTFGKHPHCVVNGEDFYGHDSIRGFYESFFRGFPDLKVNVNQRHVSEEAIILEVTLTGTHLGTFNGVPASGRHVEIPLCAIFKFDEDECILGEWVYFDNSLVREQLGAASWTESPAMRQQDAKLFPPVSAAAEPRTVIRRSVSGSHTRTTRGAKRS